MTDQDSADGYGQVDIFKIILEDAMAGYWEWNISDNRKYLSSAFEALFGYSSKDLEAIDSWQKFIYPEDLQKLAENYRAHVQSHGAVPFRNEGRYYHKNGRIIWALCTGRVVEWSKDGAPIRMVGCNIDITDHKLVKQNLSVSENRFKGAFEYSAIGMALVSTKGHWLRVNKRLCELLGYPREELLQKTFQEITHPQDLDLDLQHLNSLLKGTIPSYKMEKRYFHKKGHIIWVLLSVSLVRNSKDEPLHLVSQIEDITEMKRNQQKIESSNRELEAITHTLQRQNSQLAEFAQITSHNLRSPVSSLSMLLNMYNRLEDPIEKELIFSKFEKVIQHLSDTMDDLADVLKIKESRNLPKEKLQLEEVLIKCREILAGQIMQNNGQISYDFSAGNEVLYHRAYMESIFINLISNALKFSSPKRDPEISIYTQMVDSKLALSFADNGLGINMKRQGHKLFGLHKTFHRHPQSRGVGLFAVKAQVEAMGGEIFAKSTVDKGSVFTIVFNEKP